MKLRTKLLLPLMIVFFIGFTGFVAYQVSSQITGKMEALAADMEMDTELLATANNAYVWNLDSQGLEQSLATFLKKKSIVGIRIHDIQGTLLAGVADAETPPNLIVNERNIEWEGQVIGKAVVMFTDYFARKEVFETGMNSSVAGIILFLLIATALGLVIEISVKPVRSLLAVTKDIAEGEGDLRAVVKVKSRDEIGALSGNFNAFLGKLRTIVLELKDRGTESSGLGRNLAAKNMEVSSSVEEISSAMNSMNDRTAHLSKEIENATGIVSEVNSRIENVVAMIESQAASVNESSAAVEQMIANVGNIKQSTEAKLAFITDLTSVAKRSEESMQLNVEAISEIARSTGVIAGMIDVINNVASRTNLLAMNAAIEAAHAGESGRGFSVVADEIRKLAEQTAINAKNISRSLNEIVNRIETASGITKGTSEMISRIISGIGEVSAGMDETMDGLKEISIGNRQITESLGMLNGLTEDVKTSGKEMRDGTERISGTFTNISNIAEENRAGIDEMKAAMENISTAVTYLSNLAKENEANIDGLDRILSHFKT